LLPVVVPATVTVLAELFSGAPKVRVAVVAPEAAVVVVGAAAPVAELTRFTVLPEMLPMMVPVLMP